MVITKKELNKYFRNIKRNMDFSFNVKRQVMLSVKHRVYEFIETNDNVTIDNLIEEFGECENISLSLKEEELEFFKKKAKLYLFLEICTLFILFLVVFITIIYISTLGVNNDVIIKS